MDSSATTQPTKTPENTAGERKTVRVRHAQEKIDRIIELITKGWHNVEIARAVDVSRECVCFYRTRMRREGMGVQAKYDPASDKRIYETPAQSEAFASLMDGRSFGSNVITRSFGKMGLPNPAFVMAESNIARCG